MNNEGPRPPTRPSSPNRSGRLGGPHQEDATKYQTPRGTRDILPEEWPAWTRIEGLAADLCRLYGYRRIATPMFEDTDLYIRGVGEGTDIVDKEMYTFLDKGGNSLTLRPEGTAGIARAYVEHGMRMLPQPVKLYYLAPNFRYERPQAGRYRQHHQFGIEAFGEIDPSLDAEVIGMAMTFYRRLGVADLALQLNSIGCPACRPAYLDRLVDYYRTREGEVCGDCRRRMASNPLRLLDCKAPSCGPAIEGAPRITGALCADCADHFARLKGHLDRLGIPFSINPRLVRGLDYYTKTIFELWARGIGAQSAVGGGGRYDGLVEVLGGPPTPGIGFGIGIERAILALKEHGIPVEDPSSVEVFVVATGDRARERAVTLVQDLREKGIASACCYADRSVKAQMRAANASGAGRVVILGDDEMERGAAKIRDMASGTQEDVGLESLASRLAGPGPG